MGDLNQRTHYSSFAHIIADTFRAAFAQAKLGDSAIEMTAPEGSTKGGLLGMQHIKVQTPEGMTLVVGKVNAGEKRAELRSYALLSRVNEERFNRPLAFDGPAYAAFLETAEGVLAAFGVDVQVVDEDGIVSVSHFPPGVPPSTRGARVSADEGAAIAAEARAAAKGSPGPARPPRRRMLVMMFGGVALAVVGAIVLYLRRVRRIRR
jgi:hypothetical protein